MIEAQRTLRYDTAEVVQAGHYLRTTAGTVYLVQVARRSPRIAERWNLTCVRWPAADVPYGANVHPLFWYRRERKRPRLVDNGR